MVLKLLRFVSILRPGAFSLINRIHISTKASAPSPHSLLRRRLASAAAAAQQNSPSSSTNSTENGEDKPKSQTELVTVTFLTPDGTRYTVEGKVGDSLLDVVIDKQIPLDGYGACEGTLACSTCHVVLHKKDYDRLPNKPSDEELDMLDLAYGLTDTSRLGCQITLTKDFDGLEVTVPSGVYDARS